MKYDYLIFDLDGTISDPKEGIVKSMNYALRSHGFPEYAADELSQFIGPTLDKAFAELSSTTDKDLIAALVTKFRERYSDKGFSENVLYPDMVDTLETLYPSIKLGICTSKRVDFAEKILEMFSIRHYFTFVNGGDVGIEKGKQLESLLAQKVVNHQSIMIGDRDVDLIAAQQNNLDAAAVLWGHGSYEELIQHKSTHILSSPSELLNLVDTD